MLFKKDWFNGSWDEVKQRNWAWGFFAGFLLTNMGYGVGWLLNRALDHIGG